MNGRLDHFSRYVLGVLALAALSVGTAHGADVNYVHHYTSEQAASDGCYAYSAPIGDGGSDSGCALGGGSGWNGEPSKKRAWSVWTASNLPECEAADARSESWCDVRADFVYPEDQQCPDGMQPDADGLCVDAPECEHGEIQIGDNAGQCRDDCDALGQGETDNYWGEETTDGDYQNVSPGCDTQSGCAVAPARFHRLVDGSLVTEWTHTGSACSAGSDPVGVGESESDGCVGSGFSEFCYEEGTQDGNCGTFNGERVCFDAIPEDGACTGGASAGDSYTCGVQGDYSIIPELGDGLTADEQGAVTMANATAEATVTVSGGSVVEGDTSLDEPEPPTEGEDGAGDHDGTGDGEGEEEGFCDKAPHLCDDSKAEDLPDKDLPEDETDISELVGPGDYPNVISAPAACPEPQTFALPDSMGGASIDMPYTAFCDFAVYINPLIVSLSYLAAFFIGLRILI